jgi:hypothetical protein
MGKRLLGGVLLAFVVLASCARHQSQVAAGGGESDPAPCGHVAPFASVSCQATVQRLNEALGPALAEVLPPDASIGSNMVVEGGAVSRVTFLARPDQDGADGYEAPLRIKVGDRVGTLDIGVHSYTAVPKAAQCPSQARLRDMQSKGIQQLRCDRRQFGDAVVFVNAESDPYGSGESADMAMQHVRVTAYRADGVRIDVLLSPVVETVPSDPAARQKIVEKILTVEQLKKIAFNTSFTLS